MINILICDDNIEELEEICQAVRDYYGDNHFLAKFYNPQAALSYIEDGHLLTSPFDHGKIQYHFHDDGCFHSHLEFNDEVSTFGEGTYTVSGNEVTLKFSRRIVNCDNEKTQRIVLQRSVQFDVIKLTVNFMANETRWDTNLGDYNVTFFEDAKTEAWAESHVTSFTPAKHSH